MLGLFKCNIEKQLTKWTKSNMNEYSRLNLDKSIKSCVTSVSNPAWQTWANVGKICDKHTIPTLQKAGPHSPSHWHHCPATFQRAWWWQSVHSVAASLSPGSQLELSWGGPVTLQLPALLGQQLLARFCEKATPKFWEIWTLPNTKMTHFQTVQTYSAPNHSSARTG